MEWFHNFSAFKYGSYMYIFHFNISMGGDFSSMINHYVIFLQACVASLLPRHIFLIVV
jgi:hypothetical protein